MSLKQKTLVASICLLMAGLLLVIAVGDNGLIELCWLYGTHRQITERNTKLTQDNMRLYRSIDRLKEDLSFIEDVARRDLGMIRQDELIFKFGSKTGK
ncbi:MAG: septum formation initiator family protein [Desulfobacteraceae bacterium]|nr:septum formation initiator family protein [Desulfobacteraceae bacterium]